MFLPWTRDPLLKAFLPFRRPRLPRRYRNRPIVERLEERCLLAVFTVTITDDAGPGSLRQALLDANANPGLDTIAFAIGDGGGQTIRPNSALPVITDPVLLDATTQTGFQGTPLIVLNGASAGTNTTGLVITAGGSIVRGLVIQAFRGSGIELRTGNGNTVADNYIGTDGTGTRRVANSADGVTISQGSSDNTIGGTAAQARNVISGNGLNGINITIGSRNNVVQGNVIGTEVTGTVALGQISGVLLAGSDNEIGGSLPGAGNLISGNNSSDRGGVFIQGTGNSVEGNKIGTDRTGMQAVGNGESGVQLTSDASNNRIGGTTPGSANLLSGNAYYGVLLQGHENVVEGNLIGTDASGARSRGNGNFGIFLLGVNNTIGGTDAGAGNVISGNLSVGLDFGAGGDGNLVQGNLIGTDNTGAAALGNGNQGNPGVLVYGKNNTIGGTTSGARNLISGNAGIGVSLNGFSNTLEGNYIGTDVTGTRPLGNTMGVFLFDANSRVGGNVISGNHGDGVVVLQFLTGQVVEGNRIGTDSTGSQPLGNAGIGVHLETVVPPRLTPVMIRGNVIAANQKSGVVLTGDGHVVQGNFIGTDATGTVALGNRSSGILIQESNNNQIGGLTAEERNVISGNLGNGIDILGHGNRIQGNYLGTDATGQSPLGNAYGISIVGESDNLIGGVPPTAGNLISGNHGYGVFLAADNNRVQNNRIGTDVTGFSALGNGLAGVAISGSNNLLGGPVTDGVNPGNQISGNDLDGVFISGSANVLQANVIGLDGSLAAALANGSDGVNIVAGSDNRIGGTDPGDGNFLSGNQGYGIAVTSGTTRIQGNRIGTDGTISQAVGNRAGGVFLSEGPNNLIGGTDAGASNVISGNFGAGIEITSSSNLVQGNSIGLDGTGTQALGNSYGITIESGSGNLIGGTMPGAGNVISGQGILYLAGIYIGDSNNNLVQGNLIGTDATGTVALGNSIGIDIAHANNNTIGGATPGARNVISGNTGEAGLEIYQGSGNLVQGNYIGVDVTGTAALGNANDGVRIEGPNNLLDGNVISGNGGIGVAILDANGNVIRGNQIGTDVTGTQPLGNSANGVLIRGSKNTIGGTADGAGNLIAYNGAFNYNAAVVILEGSGNALRRNAIFGHSPHLGILLEPGANHDQAYPTLTSAVTGGITITIEGTLQSTPNTTFVLEFFANTVRNASGFGEGERFLASTAVATNASGTASFSLTVALAVPVGQFIAATATDPAGNTSQFSRSIEASPEDSSGDPTGGGGRMPFFPAAAWGGAPRVAPTADRVSREGKEGSMATTLPSVVPLDAFFAGIVQERGPLSRIPKRAESEQPRLRDAVRAADETEVLRSAIG